MAVTFELAGRTVEDRSAFIVWVRQQEIYRWVLHKRVTVTSPSTTTGRRFFEAICFGTKQLILEPFFAF